MPRNCHEVASLLLAQYPEPRLALNYANALELLVAVILSAQCTDARVNEVTRHLFMKYRTAADFATADHAALEEDIRPTGFYRNKAKAVIGCCRKLVEEFGGKVPETLEALITLPGVGRKTANMVLGNAFGKPGIAVDTHVLRVANRLGLVSSDDPEEVERRLMGQLPPAQWTAFSNAMILHGRQVCTAKKPKCGECVLYAECGWAGKLSA
ncbi:endonuclease III [Sulfuricella sp.]|uniref:endonuclease III n=1 Tax=Sulfuricella sp. TaxID=2099377 RepID=UPI002CCFA7ED|nr:endonuclease III [Sulfuricella sp.]HUX64091.1 endonuclease III [Sulfuricella sp.]